MRISSMNRKGPGFIILIAVFLALIFSGKLVTLFTDYLWFREINLVPVFLKALFTKLGCGFATGIGALIVIAVNFIIAAHFGKRSKQFAGSLDPQTELILGKLPDLKTLLLLFAATAALFIGSWASRYWEVVLKATNAVPFGVKDQLFGRDIGFYVFQLPFLRFVYFAVVASLAAAFGGCGIYFLLHRNLLFDGRRVHISRPARTQLLVLLGLLAGSLYVLFQFTIYQMVTSTDELMNGAGYARIKAAIPLLGVLRWVSIAAAIMVWAAIFGKSFRLLVGAALLLIAGAGLGFIITVSLQKFVVAPDELNKEAPYIRWSIDNTRAAYGLDKIETKHFVPVDDMSAASLDSNKQTIDNIRLWEHAPLLATYSQLQEIRTYYEFLDVDNDRYTINGTYRQVMLSPRELVPSSLPSRIWINERLTYTHGYGLCMGPVNEVTAEGLPDFFIKNIPPSSTIPLSVTRPQIYYGESDAGYAIVNTGAKEFDYPSGNENVYTVYEGTGGVPMGGIIRKALFALRFGELKILLRSDISPQSRIMYHRQVLERFRKAVPFLHADNDPYMVIAGDGRLVWILDGYTVSSAYPYSTAVAGLGNYIRNSVKAVIDAYDGSLHLYIADPEDPIIQTYARIFPGVFKPLSDMPSDLRSHIRYPQTLFTVQARIYAVYHMTDPQVFYNKEDVWRIPASFDEDNSGPMKPYYTIMKLAEVGVREEFILMVPFCPSKKENMIAWLAARCDEPNYGTLLVFDFPKQKLVYGPSQIESRINQDPEISKQLTLWNQGGSRVIRGSLLVIPVDQSLLYVQPLYLTSESGGGVPELKRVIVAFENSIAMEPTLAASLGRIFGAAEEETGASSASAPTVAGETTPFARNLKGLIEEADRQFAAGQDRLKKGDWAAYGEAMKKVERLIGEMRNKVK
ncbi:MAG: UPF0182 family protein [Chitinispirillaceae bacterium]|nr:UPF0182 family protein [Chitinispirillaceae bacterium]